MPMETRPIKPMNGNWPITHLNAGSAAATQLLAAPAKGMSHYITGYVLSGGKTGDGFSLLRKASVLLDATGENITFADTGTSYDWGTAAADGDFTLEVWLKITTTSAIADLVVRGDETSDGWALAITSAGKATFSMDDANIASTLTITGNTSINNGDWHQVVVTVDRDSTTGFNLYVDGETDATAIDPTGLTHTMDGGTDIVVTGTNSDSYNIAGLGMWIGAEGGCLTAAQVLARYNGGIGLKYTGSETDIVLGVNMDEGTGTIVYDMAGTDDGAITNATWTDGDGLCHDADTLETIPIIHCANETQVSGIGSYNIPTTSVIFPHAIKIGNSNPVRVLETDGAFTLLLFGYTDGV